MSQGEIETYIEDSLSEFKYSTQENEEQKGEQQKDDISSTEKSVPQIRLGKKVNE